MPKKVNFIGGADINGVSGGYLYNHHLMKMLRAKQYVIHYFDVNWSFDELDLTIPTIVDSLVVKQISQQLQQHQITPILLYHLPPELNTRVQHTSSLTSSTLDKLIKRSHVVTTGKVSFDYMQDKYGLDDAQLHLIEPGLIKDWRSKVYYKSLPSKLMVVASLLPDKGYEMLLPALADCLDLDWSMTFFGDDSFDPAFADKVTKMIAELGLANRMHYGGTLSQIKLNMAMIASDLLVQYSTFETYSMVTNEAISAGLPVLSTQTGNHPVFSQSGLVRYLPEYSYQACVDNLRTLLTDPDQYANLRPRKAIQKRSWLDVANDFENVLEA